MFAVLCASSIGNDDQPHSAASWNSKGLSLYSQGNYGEALQAFNNSIELDPRFPQTFYNKGNALYSQGKYDEAIEAYNKVVELDPQYAYAWFAKGKAHYYQRKYAEAIQALDKAIELNPQDTEAGTIKVNALKALGRTTEANDAFAETSELSQRAQGQITSSFSSIVDHPPNQPPDLVSLNPDHPSPQDAGTDIVWTASASDSERDPVLYRFLLNGRPVTDWNIENTWTWETAEDDEGENRLEVQVRDEKNAGPNDFDDKMSARFVINRMERQSKAVVLGGSKTHSYVPGPAFTDHKPSYVPGEGAHPVGSV